MGLEANQRSWAELCIIRPNSVLAEEEPAPSRALEAGGGGTLEALNSDELKEDEDEEGDGHGGPFFALCLRETRLLRPMVGDERDGCGRLKRR